MLKSTKEKQKDLDISYTNIYSTAISNFNAIKTYTLQSMHKNIENFEKGLDPIEDITKRLFKNLKKEKQDFTLLKHFSNYTNNLSQIICLLHEIPSNLIVSYVTNFDRFMSNMLTYILNNVEGQMFIIDESVKYGELNDCTDISSIKNFYIEKFVDSFFRKSHEEQFKWLDEKLSLNIRKQMPNYDDFIFLCKLRNLIVHNDCKLNNFSLTVKDIEKYKTHGFNLEKKQKNSIY